jgi:hypothetical protein
LKLKDASVIEPIIIIIIIAEKRQSGDAGTCGNAEPAEYLTLK